eukprot:15111771-Alexandrium_andersonii.AAC.1
MRTRAGGLATCLRAALRVRPWCVRHGSVPGAALARRVRPWCWTKGPSLARALRVRPWCHQSTLVLACEACMRAKAACFGAQRCSRPRPSGVPGTRPPSSLLLRRHSVPVGA